MSVRGDQIRVVLVETQGEANLGAIARSLSCFGVNDWWLVRGQVKPGVQASNWACHGREWLGHLKTADTLSEALEGVDLSVALTGKSGKRRHRLVTPSQLTQDIFPRFQIGRVALVFGNEESGLDNSDIAICHWRVKVPTDEVHSSLNLAHTVSLMLYELVGRNNTTDLGGKPQHWASPELLRRALAEIGQFLGERGYPSHANTMDEELRKINDILHRVKPEIWEVNFLLGMLRHLRHYEAGRLSEIPAPESEIA